MCPLRGGRPDPGALVLSTFRRLIGETFQEETSIARLVVFASPRSLKPALELADWFPPRPGSRFERRHGPAEGCRRVRARPRVVTPRTVVSARKASSRRRLGAIILGPIAREGASSSLFPRARPPRPPRSPTPDRPSDAMLAATLRRSSSAFRASRAAGTRCYAVRVGTRAPIAPPPPPATSPVFRPVSSVQNNVRPARSHRALPYPRQRRPPVFRVLEHRPDHRPHLPRSEPDRR